MGILEIVALAILCVFAVVGIICLILITIFYVKKHRVGSTGAIVKKTKAERDLEWASNLVKKLEKQVEEQKK